MKHIQSLMMLSCQTLNAIHSIIVVLSMIYIVTGAPELGISTTCGDAPRRPASQVVDAQFTRARSTTSEMSCITSPKSASLPPKPRPFIA